MTIIYNADDLETLNRKLESDLMHLLKCVKLPSSLLLVTRTIYKTSLGVTVDSH